MKPKLRAGILWLAVVAGFSVGIFALAGFGMSGTPYGDDPGWYLRWVAFVGLGLLGAGFLIGSITALWRPKLAAIFFFAFLPVASFCLSYPDAGFLVWHTDGSGWFESPLPLTAVGLTVLFFAPFIAPLFTWHRKRWAAIVFAATAAVAISVFVHSRWSTVLLPRLAGYAAPFLLFGLFWLWSHKRGWPPLFRTRQHRMTGHLASVAYASAMVLCLDVALTMGLAAFASSLSGPDCGPKPPFSHQLSASHAVFTARAVFVGSSIDGLFRDKRAQDSSMGDWAIGVVQEKFWGLSSWQPRLVLLTDFAYWKGETYFIDGSRGRGLVTRFLPIVAAGPCSRSKPIQDAIVDLRLLRGDLSNDGTHLIGYVTKPKIFVPGFARQTPPEFVAGAKIAVSGSGGTQTITTDASGVYQLDGLAPGDYTLRLEMPQGEFAGFFGDASPAKIHLTSGGLAVHNFDVFWNGQIGGQVRDASGKPARAWVEVLSSNGNQLPGYVRDFLLTNPDGSYDITKIPPGRYVVIVNPYGPSEESPYNVQYYPAGWQSRNARVLEVGPGQEIAKIDFTVSQLAGRTIRVHVAWADGKPADDAWVYVAYPHTKAFDSLTNATDFRRTDHSGNAELLVFGDSRIRVFAEAVIDNGTPRGSSRYSTPVELNTTALATNLNLALSASTLREPSQP